MDDKYNDNGLETSEQLSEDKLDVGSSSSISYPGEVEMAGALAPLDGVSKLLESFYCLEESEADKNFGLSDSHYSLPSLPMELEHFSAAYFQENDRKIGMKMKMKDFNPNRQNIDDPTDFFIATPDKSSPKTRKKKQTVDYQHSKK